MIRTLIEVTAETPSDHEHALKATLDKLGFEPKRSADHVRWDTDLYRGLRDRGIEPREVVDAYRKKIGADNAG